MKNNTSLIITNNQKLVDYAIEFATKAHEGQMRRYTNTPYIEHPIAVAKLVQSVTDDYNMIVASLLHDTVEDTPITITMIYNEFGQYIEQYVLELTQFSVPGDGNRIIRKNLDLRYLDRVSKQAKTIKLADLIHNSESILQYSQDGFKHIFMKEMSSLLNVLRQGDIKLYKQAHNICKEYYRSINE